MAKAVCPVCEQLVTITPTGERQGKDPNNGRMPSTTSTWWLVADHFPPWCPPGQEPKPCKGSGQKV